MTTRLDQVRGLPPVAFGEAVLRGVGQVFLQNNPVTGALMLLGIFLSSRVSGAYAVLGTVVATGVAMLLGVPRRSVAQGLYGFNGTLTAIDLSFYVHHQWRLAAYVVLACAAVTVVTAAIQNFLNSDHIPSLTAAFVATTWIFLAALRQFANVGVVTEALPHPQLPAAHPPPAGSIRAGDVLSGFLNGFSEVMLQSGAWTGVAFLVGILVNSRISAAMAAMGSIVALGSGWMLGLPATTLSSGLAGYNGVLTAIALGGLYYLFSVRTALFTAVAAVWSVVVLAMLTTVLSPLGLPVVTAPFVLTTWLCLFAATSLTRLRSVDPQDATTAEGNLRSSTRTRESATVPGGGEESEAPHSDA